MHAAQALGLMLFVASLRRRVKPKILKIVPHATPLRRNGNQERHTTGIFSW
jgi:hypothetical protein